MIRILTSLSLVATLTACGTGTQPFVFDPSTAGDGNGGTGGTTGDESTSGSGTLGEGTELPPGTAEPTVAQGIFRAEKDDDNGGGLVRDVAYNSANDTFVVDNIGFDGANVYSRDNQVGTLNGAAVYESDISTNDFLTGNPIEQINRNRVLFKASNNTTTDGRRTSYAIVRSGGYVSYGFGGFVYERNGGVTLPSAGQARFSGDYSGVRVFQERAELQYTTGDMTIDIDFDDFNANDAVKGKIEGRQAFTIDGIEIEVNQTDRLQLPTLHFVIQEGVPTLTTNGELSGSVASSVRDDTGALEVYETGSYYGIVAGDTTDIADGGEIVGVIVMTSTDPVYDVSAQETGGFILYR